MVELVVQNLRKSYGSFTAIDDISFTIADGEFVTLLGPSGCGKTTTLAAVAGLDTPTSGLIRAGATPFFDGEKGINVPTEGRNCGLVFQSYALWPHMTIWDNVAYPLKIRKVGKAEQQRRIEKVLDVVEMGRFAKRYPHELSGGQQQRAALARTLVYEPSVLLLDEPLSNLDAKLRERARAWLAELKEQVRLTTLYVTHDQVEALTLSDRIVVMNGGRIVQIGTPREIYETPATPFVADFIGTSSFLKGRVVGSDADQGLAVQLAGGPILQTDFKRAIPKDTDVSIALRPERLRIVDNPDAQSLEPGCVTRANVRTRSYMGSHWHYELTVCDAVVKVQSQQEETRDELYLWLPGKGSLVFEGSDKAA
jgi:iron(III) transport system ATP-binding protein